MAQEHLTIPKMFYPWIRGPFNEVFDRISQETGARINIPPPTASSDIIVVTGEKEGVHKAVAWIRRIYDEKVGRGHPATHCSQCLRLLMRVAVSEKLANGEHQAGEDAAPLRHRAHAVGPGRDPEGDGRERRGAARGLGQQRDHAARRRGQASRRASQGLRQGRQQCAPPRAPRLTDARRPVAW